MVPGSDKRLQVEREAEVVVVVQRTPENQINTYNKKQIGELGAKGRVG